MKAKKAAAYFATKNAYVAMIPAVNSLAANTDIDEIHLFIEDDEFPGKLPEQCVIHNLAGQTVFRKTGPNYASKWTYMSMMRVMLPYFLPDLDRILYLDIDTIVTKDISELWILDLTGKYFAAVREPEKSREDFIYINAGVMMMNLEQMRDGLAKEMADLLNRHFYPCKEQDLYSGLCQGKFMLLPGDYNVSDFTDEPSEEKKIIHYAATRMEKWYWDELVQRYVP